MDALARAVRASGASPSRYGRSTAKRVMAWRRCASLKSTSAGAELLLSSMPASSPDLPQLTSRVRKGIVQRTVGLAPDGSERVNDFDTAGVGI